MKKAIQALNLSKKYRLCHEDQPAYSTIVETVSKQAKKLAKSFLGKTPKQETTYEEFWALKEVEFSCEPGDRLGIIGKNGAGKSTLLKILSRIIEPTGGSVEIRGRVASLLEVGTGFHPELTGRENIFLNGAILGMGKAEIIRKFDEIVAFSEVERFLDTPVKYYSSGMYARLGFAIAAHVDPDILIVDEVLAVGDLQFQQKCLHKMDDVSRSGRTILFVSHNTAATLALCNKGLYLEGGSVKYFGAIEPCIDEYLKTTQHSSFSWQGNLGNEEFRIRSAELERSKDFFYQNEGALLRIECEVLRKDPKGIFGIEIKNSRRQTVVQSFINSGSTFSKQLSSPGLYQLTLSIPPGIFWEGEYAIHPLFLNDQHQRIINEEVSLKMPIYKESQEQISYQNAAFDGTILNAAWKIIQKEGKTKECSPSF